MKRFHVTSKQLFQVTVTLLAIPALLALITMSLFFFFIFGGGWAYAGTAGCHFRINSLGMIMLAAVAASLSAVLFAIGRRVAERYRAR
jgi:hypothetical protein